MNRLLLLIAAALVLGACKTGNSVRISNEKPVAVQTKARSEPIFYNGRTYQLDFSTSSAGVFDMAVSGMGPKQKNDAVAVATSSLGYYACPEGKRGKLRNEPSYAGSKWLMRASCG